MIDTIRKEQLEVIEESMEEIIEEISSQGRAGNDLFYRISKKIFDIIMSLIAIILIFPIFIMIALCIKIEDGGSVFYMQKRIGKNGKPITLLKFRSMVQNAGDLYQLLSAEQLEEYHKEFKVSNDPRITKVGKFIRCGFDELPQILLIFTGDLSFIGPRPLVAEELEENYGSVSHIFTSVTPGLTGYWQAYAHNQAKYNNKQRQRMELYYIYNRSFWLDIKIIFRTVKRVVTNQ